jgi:DNA modification methylase
MTASRSSPTPFRHPPSVDAMGRIVHGDVSEEIAKLPDNSVHCVVTSPPYWGLRDYGGRKWIGGSDSCGHFEATVHPSPDPGEEGNQWRLEPTKTCQLCGAWFGQLGHEPTLEMYIENQIAVFRQVRRVLHPTGTLWLNIGDSYARQGGVGAPGKSAKVGMTRSGHQRRNCKPPQGLKSKDLMRIPARMVAGLQADGWWLRAENIWYKPNAMPETVTDRTTRAHEMVYLLTKSGRYFYDGEAIRETRNPDDEIARLKQALSEILDLTGEFQKAKDIALEALRPVGCGTGANKRSVWVINSRPYPGAHFAVMPLELAELCVKAGSSSAGVCSKCLTPLKRKSEKAPCVALGDATGGLLLSKAEVQCKCGAEVVPSIVFDPFAGSGTVLLAARNLGRNYLGIELNAEYVALCNARLNPQISGVNRGSPQLFLRGRHKLLAQPANM